MQPESKNIVALDTNIAEYGKTKRYIERLITPLPILIVSILSVLLALKIDGPGLERILSAIAFFLFSFAGAFAVALYPLHKHLNLLFKTKTAKEAGIALTAGALVLFLGVEPVALLYGAIAAFLGAGLAFIYSDDTGADER